MKKYKQLTQELRYQISASIESGNTQTIVASSIGVSKSTISRELRRNTSNWMYDATEAHNMAMKRRRESRKALKMTPDLIKRIDELLRQEWSPEEISGSLRLKEGIGISHERIYQHVIFDRKQGGSLYRHLRCCGKKRKKRCGQSEKQGQIKNRISIDERPGIVDEKSRLGDWEIDTVIGKNHKQALVTIVERLSKKVIIRKVQSKHAETVTESTISSLKPLSKHILTITADNGKEFSYHEKISAELESDFYFAHPYRSWERGLNENTNKLIRQYIVKGLNFDWIDDAFVQKVEDRLNNRPRKTLGYRTPNEVFSELAEQSS